MRRVIAGLTLAALVAALVAAPVAAATTITGGNSVQARAYLDSYTNFVIVDTNNPISGTGALTSWSYWAAQTGQVQLVIVRGATLSGGGQIVYTSPVSSATLTGEVTVALAAGAYVQAGDEVGLYFVGQAIVPFDGLPAGGTSGAVLYTANNDYTSPNSVAVGDSLTFEGATPRVYSVSVTGFAYSFTGFFSPISMTGTNVVRAGSAVPVQFSLGGDEGLNIFAPGYPMMQPVYCSSTAASGDTVATVTAGASSLSYDPTSGTYTYVWKTSKDWSGTCGVLEVQLADGTMHTATFQFR